jgi:hypothetical protein
MARARSLKPALFRNEILGTADPFYTLLFESLWLIADREGRLEDRPIRIKADTFPYREGIDIDAMLTWLHDNGFIIRYDSRNYASDSGKNASHSRFIQIVNFLKHQNPHRNEAESIIPAYSSDCENSRKNPSDSRNYASASEEIGSAPALTLNPVTCNLNPLPLSPAAAPKEEESPHLFSDSDTRRFFAMPMDWNPDPVELQKYVNGKIHAGKPLPLETVLGHLGDYREATHAKGENRTESEWCRALVKWAQRCMSNPAKPASKPPTEQAPLDLHKPIITPPPFSNMRGARDPELAARAKRDRVELFHGKQ